MRGSTTQVWGIDRVEADNIGMLGTVINSLMKDPNKFRDAVKYSSLTYDEVIQNNLRVMDQSAFILARDHHLPIHVFDIGAEGAMPAM